MNKKYKAKLVVHDLSMKNGGDIKGHGSHESGRDVDIGFYTYKNGYYDNKFIVMCKSSGNVCKSNSVLPIFSNDQALAANWDFINYLAETYDINAIFIDRELIKVLKSYAQKNNPPNWNTLIKLLSHEPNHHHHYHVRIKCPIGDSKCKGPDATKGVPTDIGPIPVT